MSEFQKADNISLEDRLRCAYYNLTYWARYFQMVKKSIKERDRVAQLEEDNATLVRTNKQLAEWAKIRMSKEFSVEADYTSRYLLDDKLLDSMSMEDLLRERGYSEKDIDELR